MAKRNPTVLGRWGTEQQGGTRVVAAESYWQEPLKWNKQAEKTGKRRRVFCASMSDVFESWNGLMLNHKGEALLKPYLESENTPAYWINEPLNVEGKLDRSDMQGWQPVTMQDIRNRLFDLIDATPWLDWQLLTKRPENIIDMWPDTAVGKAERDAYYPYPPPRGFVMRHNVWLGTTVENQKQAEKRIPELLECSDLSPVLWLSCEPLLGQLELAKYFPSWFAECDRCGWSDHVPCRPGNPCGSEDADEGCCQGNLTVSQSDSGVSWVIAGAEIGHHARPTDIEWFRSLRDQCQLAGVPFFHKQMMVDGKLVKQLDQFPEEFRIQQFPEVKS